MQLKGSKGGFMRKFIVAAIIFASLATVAARQPAAADGDHMQMMMNCPMSGMMMSSVDVKYEATENGARLTFTPKDPAMLPELQTKIREMAERMGKADGSMMRGMMRNRNDEGTHDFHHPAK
jgi:polyhydroxyalkanoate synthesis regulator protein